MTNTHDKKGTAARAYDVIVAGAGPAGVAAALAAARSGARTAIIEAHGCLGGVWTAGQLAWIFEGESSSIAVEITDALAAMHAREGSKKYHYSYDIESMKFLLERLCREAGVRIRLHTRVVDAVVTNGRITEMITESKSGRERWKAKVFIDCTGDGDLGAYAGCSYDVGGPEGELQPCTLMALITVKDRALLKDRISFHNVDGDPWEHHAVCINNLMQDFKDIGVEPSYGRPTIFHVRNDLCALMVNHAYKVSAMNADDITDATIRARAEIYTLVEKLRTHGGIWEGVTLAATAEQIGIREGRRLHGLYTISTEDLIRGAAFDDGVCTCSFGVDVHSPDPDKDRGLSHMGVRTKSYQIPYRSLVAKDVKGLLMAGRCISGGWLPHASYRVTGTAAALGEAAGRSAAYAVKKGKLPDAVLWRDVPALP